MRTTYGAISVTAKQTQWGYYNFNNKANNAGSNIFLDSQCFMFYNRMEKFVVHEIPHFITC